MVIRDYTLDQQIGQKMLETNRLERLGHESSGKLTASMLGWPLQWQILKVRGVDPEPFDEFTLRTFRRGKDVEDTILKLADNVVTTQLKVLYRDVVGYVDAVMTYRGNAPELQNLNIPHEIKSVTNMKYKRITRSGEADPQHRLQACLYALAVDSDYYAIDYIASDDLRVETFIYKTEDTKKEVDEIIDTFNNALKSDAVPLFKARYDWQANPKYCNYPTYMNI